MQLMDIEIDDTAEVVPHRVLCNFDVGREGGVEKVVTLDESKVAAIFLVRKKETIVV